MKCNYCLFCGEKTIVKFHSYSKEKNYTNYHCVQCNTQFNFIRHLDDNDKEDGWTLARKIFKISNKGKFYEVVVNSDKTVIRTLPQYEILLSISKELNLNPSNVKEKILLYLLFI